jgi:purine-cytosine permease-like protein
LRSFGKNRALFGLIELTQFGYQYYVAVLGIIALILAILGIKQERLKEQITAVLLSLLAITIVFVRVWRFFI